MASLYMLLLGNAESLAEELKTISENPKESERIEHIIDEDLKALGWS